jgi:hypothetical protein
LDGIGERVGIDGWVDFELAGGMESHRARGTSSAASMKCRAPNRQRTPVPRSAGGQFPQLTT